MKSRGFTLIELLVVISIIGMLASVVLASLSGARQKAVIGAGQQFDSSLYHAFGANVAITLDLNGNALDSSGNGNTINVIGSSPTNYTWTTGPTGASNSALQLISFTGVTISAPIQNFPSVSNSTGSYTISVWVKPDVATSGSGVRQCLVAWGGDVLNIAGPNSRAVLTILGNQVEFSQWYNDTASTKALVTAGLWQQVTVSYNAGSAAIYVNGKLADTLAMNNVMPIVIASFPAYVGIDYVGRPFAGSIDNVRVYSQSLKTAEIERLYAMEAPAHGIALK